MHDSQYHHHHHHQQAHHDTDHADEQEGGDPERLDITFGGTALHAAVSSNQDDQACSMITITITTTNTFMVN